jgi:hypothetical protein
VSDAPEPEQVTVRRAPKFPAFMIVGGGIGAIVTFVLTALQPVDPAVGFGALFAYFSLFGVTAGVLLGAVLALILDRRATRRATGATAERETVARPSAEDELEE